MVLDYREKLWALIQFRKNKQSKHEEKLQQSDMNTQNASGSPLWDTRKE